MSTTKERPILFSAPMVRAILNGNKTQTRRVVKPQPFAGKSDDEMREFFIKNGALGRDESLTGLVNGARNAGFIDVKCPYGKLGDRLWVRETWRTMKQHDFTAPRDIPNSAPIEYDADDYRGFNGKLRPSIFMPRWASRITLEITAVRVEKLQDITEADAMAEGIVSANGGNGYQLADTTHYAATARDSFFSLWESIKGDSAVEENPWVWVVEFKRVAA